LTSLQTLNNGLFTIGYNASSEHQFTGMVFIGKTTQTVNLTWRPTTTWSDTRGPSQRGPEGSLDLVDNISYLRGNHSFKFGFEYVDAIFDGNPTDQAEGQIKFKSLEGFSEPNMRSMERKSRRVSSRISSDRSSRASRV
jgi:hypothetical protein